MKMLKISGHRIKKIHKDTAGRIIFPSNDTKAGIHSRGSNRSEYEPGSVTTEN